ncbi:hypothetical protein [Athalassotoga saccharophila]|uniref:hypothetical protein n=1 Tax=Athalassotoga saccharophila TaxID=1441386 RepID=UPI00137B73E1|nr:hypothetical protein [Athalassotoga saccharophila]BBJ28566.1 hypothetical protein ATHSA_1483 [Athalassotoga saccharophila]
MVKYPIMFRTCLAMALGTLAIFIPFLPLKIILGVLSLIIFAINMRRYAFFLIAMIVIFGVVIAIRNVPYNFISNFGVFSFTSETIYPDTYIQGSRNLSINVTGLDLTFDPSTNTIYIPSILNVKRNKNILDISSNQNNVTFRIVVGTKDGFTNAYFQTTGLKVNGSILAENVVFNSTGIEMNSSIVASKISINGVGINLNGTLKASSIEINGTGDNLDLMVSANTIKINGVSIDGNLKYVDKWAGSRSILVNAISGNLSVYTLSSNEGYLDIQNTGGFLKINRVRY